MGTENIMKSVAAAAAALTVAGAASSANAAITLLDISTIGPYTGELTDSAFPGGIDVYLGPAQLTTNVGVFIVPCIDPFDLITDGAHNYVFTLESLPSDISVANSTNVVLNNNQVGEIGALFNLMEAEVAKPAPDQLLLAAIQSQIWKIEGADLTLDSGFSGVQSAFTADQNTVFSYAITHETAGFNFIKDSADGTQSFAFPPISIPSVPEPATWSLMIAGFAAVGGALRHQRRKAAAPQPA